MKDQKRAGDSGEAFKEAAARIEHNHFDEGAYGAALECYFDGITPVRRRLAPRVGEEEQRAATTCPTQTTEVN